MRPDRSPHRQAQVDRNIVRLRRQKRRHRRDDNAAPTPVDPRVHLPLAERAAVVETLLDGVTTLTTFFDPPLRDLGPAADELAEEPSNDEESPRMPLPPPTAARDADAADKAARWTQYATHSGQPDDHR